MTKFLKNIREVKLQFTSRHMLPEHLPTAAPKISGCFLQNSNLAPLMFDLC